ncbi:MAG TPA: ABC transporter ATP-binding protein [Mycobacteriales bacterium]|nr:ABC transporter ATP-binding protein [Mycobacteriales bacterium]
MSPLAPGEILLEGVGKRFTKYEDTPTLAYGLLHAFKRSRRGKLWAVQDLDLHMNPGESIGIVGRNGSGKSTLLQMMCGVTSPTTGRVRVGGRIAPLISVGVGFHPELTGRENVFVNGTILGLTRREITRRLDEIIAFSEIEAFIDTPVKFYSSGMYVRLGFSVAAHVDPDVLLIDEVLAVGDIGFVVKCYQHISDLRARGCTAVLVSHNMAALEQYCDRGLVLDRSRQVFDGTMAEAVGVYHERSAAAANQPAGKKQSDDLRLELDVVDVLDISVTDGSGGAKTRFDAGDEAVVRVRVQAKAYVNTPWLSVTLISGEGITVYREYNLFEPYPPLPAGTTATLMARVPLNVTTGGYSLEVAVGRGHPTSREFADLPADIAYLSTPKRLPLFVRGRNTAHGIADLRARFVAEGE